MSVFFFPSNGFRQPKQLQTSNAAKTGTRSHKPQRRSLIVKRLSLSLWLVIVLNSSSSCFQFSAAADVCQGLYTVRLAVASNPPVY